MEGIAPLTSMPTTTGNQTCMLAANQLAFSRSKVNCSLLGILLVSSDYFGSYKVS